MILLNPKQTGRLPLDARSREIVEKTVAFFESKGKRRLREDDLGRVWYADFLDFVRREEVFADLLTPPAYGGPHARWDTYRNCFFNEVLGFYGLCYWYTWQVSILGLGPIWMSDNEAVKKRTGELLRAGGIFAFGLSEKEHGADIYSTEMTLTPQAGGGYLANGGKYYIGNGNEAALVSVFGIAGARRVRLLRGRPAPAGLRAGQERGRQPVLRGRVQPGRLRRWPSPTSCCAAAPPGMPPSTPSTSASTTWAGRRSASARTPSTRP